MATNYGSFSWPSAAAGSNASVGTTGSTAPTSATEIGGINPSGNLQGVNVDAAGNLIVSSAGVNTSGSYAQITNLTTTAQTFTAPAGAIGFIMEADSSVNTVNLRWSIGSAATTTSGLVLEPGRDTGYIPCGANISVIAVSGVSQSVAVQWVIAS